MDEIDGTMFKLNTLNYPIWKSRMEEIHTTKICVISLMAMNDIVFHHGSEWIEKWLASFDNRLTIVFFIMLLKKKMLKYCGRIIRSL